MIKTVKLFLVLSIFHYPFGIIVIIIINTLLKEDAQLDIHPVFPGVLS